MAKNVSSDPEKQAIIEMLEQTMVLKKHVEEMQAKVKKIMEQLIKQAGNKNKLTTPK